MNEAKRLVRKIAAELLNRKWDAEDGKLAAVEMEQWANTLYHVGQILENHRCEHREDA